MEQYSVVEVCAGAGGQALGLEAAGFTHELAVEIDPDACATLRRNRPHWKIAQGDATSPYVWKPSRYRDKVDLLAGGVPCPPFTVAGKQLGATDERDLYAWAIELCGTVRPRALLLENVPGLSLPRFAAYRQHVLARLAELGYAAEWQFLHASDFGVPQLRPRYVLVAMRPDDFAYFTWPQPRPGKPPTVGEALADLMAANGWPGAGAWSGKANGIAPTIVGGSKKHGGADLGPTRAKNAWRELGVDARSVADAAPPASAPDTLIPKLTTAMVARIQAIPDSWVLTGLKTAKYRQLGNALPPPVAQSVGEQIRIAFSRVPGQGHHRRPAAVTHDPVYAVLRADGGFLTLPQILARAGLPIDTAALEQRLDCLARDFTIERRNEPGTDGPAVKLGRLKSLAAGPDDYLLHEQIRRITARKPPVPRPPAAPVPGADPSLRM